MATSSAIAEKLVTLYSGQPWYGNNIYSILGMVTFETAYERPAPQVHTIAEIILHMLGYTEEVTERMKGKPAGEPARGDWPDAGAPDEQKWQQMVNYLKLANINLEKAIQDFPEERWPEPINDQRGTEPITSYKGLIEGFLQHQVYHAGQISLLIKQING